MTKKCAVHPKYTGKRQPKHQCFGCLNLYLNLHTAPRVQHRPTKVVGSKKTYCKKLKHKSRIEDDQGR